MQSDLVAGRNVSSTSLDSMVFTLDPKDKYLPPGVHRASTTSAIKKRKAQVNPIPKILHRSSSTPMNAGSPPKTSDSSCAGQSTLDRQRSLTSVFHKIRKTRSAGSNTKSGLAWSRRLLSRTGDFAKIEAEHDIPEVPKLPIGSVNAAFAHAGDIMESSIQRPPIPCGEVTNSKVPPKASLDSVIVPWPQENIPLGEYQPPQAELPNLAQEREPGRDSDFSIDLYSATGMERRHIDQNPPSVEVMNATISSQPHEQRDRDPSLKAVRDRLDLTITIGQPAKSQVYHTRPSNESQTSREPSHGEHTIYATTSTNNYAESSRFSYAPSENFSPGFASNTTCSGPMSPLHLSQPETPIMSDFEDGYDRDIARVKRDSRSSAQLETDVSSDPEFIAPRPPSRAPPPPPPLIGKSPTPRSALGNFQGYSLPDDDHASALTLRKLPSRTLKKSSSGGAFDSQTGNQDLVRSWNDGSEHLLDDLGYLGELIV